MSELDDLFERAASCNEQELAELLRSLSDDQRDTIEKMLAASESLQQRGDFLRPIKIPDSVNEATFISAPDHADPDETYLSGVDVSSTESVVGDNLRYFGEYELIDEIARGGMGVVFKAKQVSLNRIVALKMILSGNLAGSDEVTRFRIEAEAAARLDHPGIVPIYEIGEHEGQHYFSMGFIDGPSLRDAVRDGPLPAKEAVTLSQKIANAISYAHENGVIHRDLKPANVLLDSDGEPKITDFGLAKQIQDDSGLTQTGAVMGTPGYMPPEQASGDMAQVGALADVYSVGAILYCLVTGRPPFQAVNTIDTLTQAINEEPIPPRQLNSGVDADVETIILKCLEKQIDRRYDSADALSQELGRYLNGEPIVARPISRMERIWRWGKRKPAAATVCALAATLLLLLSIGGPLIALQQRNFAKEQVRLQEAAAVERNAAVVARGTAEAATQEVERQQERAQGLLYATRISLAHREWLDGNPTRTRQLLAECPPDKRNWEWKYLDGLTRAEDVAIFAHQIPASVEYMPGGSQLLTRGTSDNRVSFWNATSGLEQDTTTIPNIRNVVAASETHVLVFAGDSVFHARAKDGQKTDFGGFGSVALAGLVHGDGKKLATAFGDGSVIVYELDSGKEMHRMPQKRQTELAHVFSVDAKFVAGVQDGRVRVWDVQTGAEKFEVAGHVGKVEAIAFSPDGETLASAGRGGSVFLTDRESGRRIRDLSSHEAGITSLAFNADGSQIVTGSLDRTARIYDVSNGNEILVIRGHEQAIVGVSFHPDGSQVATASKDGTVRTWTVNRQLTVSKEVQETLQGASHLGHRIGLEARMLYGQPGMVYDVRVSPDRRFVATTAVGSTSGVDQICVWSLADSSRYAGFPVSKGLLHTLEFSADSRYLIVASGGAGDVVQPGSVTVWDLETKERLREMDGVSCMLARPALNAANDLLAVAYGNLNYGRIRVYSFPDCELLQEKEVTGQRLSSLVFSKSEDVVVTATAPGGTIQSWDARSGKELGSFSAHGSGVFQIDISSDHHLATANTDGTIGIWDWRKQKKLGELKGHGTYCVDVCFSPDGSRLLSSSEDETVKVWDLNTFSELLSFRDHRSPALGADWSKDGSTLATTSRDGVLIVRELQGLTQHVAGAEEEWVTIFEDDFERNEIGDNWSTGTPNPVGWAIEDGRLVATLQTTKLPGNEFPGAFIGLRPIDLPRRAEVSAEVRMQQKMLVQLVLMNRRTQQYVAPFIASTTQPYGAIGSAVQVARGAGHQTKLLNTRPGVHLEPQQLHRLKAIRNGDQLRFYLDDILISDTRIPALETDQLTLSGCFGELGDRVAFDNVLVRIPKAAVREMEIRQKVNSWLTRTLIPEVAKEYLAEEFAENPDDHKIALQFLDGLNAEDAFTREDVISAIETVANQPDASPEAYEIAARQADVYHRLLPDNWWDWSKLGLAFARAGQFDKALDRFDQAAERSRTEDGHVLPLIVAGRALTLHQMGREDDALKTHEELRDLMLTGWGAVGLDDLKKELEEKVPLPDIPIRNQLIEQILTSRKAFYYNSNANKELADFAADVQVTQGRARKPDQHDREYDRKEFLKLEAIYSTSYPVPNVHIIWDEVEFNSTKDKATVAVIELLKFVRQDFTKEMIMRFGLGYDFEKRDGKWVVVKHRIWQIDVKNQADWTYRNADHWAELDKRIAKLADSGSKLELATVCKNAGRIPEALSAAKAAAEDESLSPADRAKALAIVGETEVGLAQFEAGIAALEQARQFDPAVQMPWFFTRVKQTFKAKKTAFAIAFSPEDGQMASAHDGGDINVTVWDMKTGKPDRTFDANVRLASDLAYFDNGRKLVTTGFDQAVNVFEADTGKRIKQYTGHLGFIFRLESHPLRSEIVVTCSADDTAKIWDLNAERELVSLSGHSRNVMTAAFSPDGTRIATGSRDETIRLWDVATGRELQKIEAHKDGVWRVDWTADGKRLVSVGHDETVRIWDTETWTELAAMSGHKTDIESLRVSPDGKLAASGDIDGVIYVWDLTDFKPLAVLNAHRTAAYDLQFHNGDLYSASGDATVRRWDVNFTRSPLLESVESVSE